MRARDFDARFDDGEDISDALDVDRAERSSRKQRRVNVDIPTWMIESLDHEAERLGITRQSIIKMWLGERLERQNASRGSDRS